MVLVLVMILVTRLLVPFRMLRLRLRLRSLGLVGVYGLHVLTDGMRLCVVQGI